jgi:hypothetical protein
MGLWAAAQFSRGTIFLTLLWPVINLGWILGVTPEYRTHVIKRKRERKTNSQLTPFPFLSGPEPSPAARRPSSPRQFSSRSLPNHAAAETLAATLPAGARPRPTKEDRETAPSSAAISSPSCCPRWCCRRLLCATVGEHVHEHLLSTTSTTSCCRWGPSPHPPATLAKK